MKKWRCPSPGVTLEPVAGTVLQYVACTSTLTFGPVTVAPLDGARIVRVGVVADGAAAGGAAGAFFEVHATVVSRRKRTESPTAVSNEDFFNLASP